MSALKIIGSGHWVSVLQLPAEQAKRYAHSGRISYDIYLEFWSENEGFGLGACCDADVYVDDICLGTIKSIIEHPKVSDKFLDLKQALDSDFDIACGDDMLVFDTCLDGDVVNTFIPDYDIYDATRIPDDFLNDFLTSLRVVHGCLFALNDWNGEDLEDCSSPSGKESVYVFYAGQEIQLEFNDEPRPSFLDKHYNQLKWRRTRPRRP